MESLLLALGWLLIATDQGGAGSPPTLILPTRAGEVSSEVRIRCGPSVPARALAFAPGSALLAVGGRGEVLLWDLEAGRLRSRLAVGEPTGRVTALAFARDGVRLAFAAGEPGEKATVGLLDTRDGKILRSFAGPADQVLALAFAPEDAALAAGGAGGSVFVWNLADGSTLATLPHPGWVLGLAFSHDGKMLATGGTDRVARLWDLATAKVENELPQADAVRALAFRPAGELLALGVGGPNARGIRTRQPATIRPFQAKKKDAPTGPPKPFAEPAWSLDTGAGAVNALAWDPRGSRLYAACGDGTLRVVSPAGSLLGNLRGGHTGGIDSVAVGRNGAVVATGGADGTVAIWDPRTDRRVATLVSLGPGSESWAIVTASGAWCGSGADAVTDSQGRAIEQQPAAVRSALAGTQLPAEERAGAGKGKAAADKPKKKAKP